MERQDHLERRRVGQQALALCCVVLPPIGLYFSVATGLQWATWLLLAVIAFGNVMAIWVS